MNYAIAKVKNLSGSERDERSLYHLDNAIRDLLALSH